MKINLIYVKILLELYIIASLIIFILVVAQIIGKGCSSIHPFILIFSISVGLLSYCIRRLLKRSIVVMFSVEALN